MAASKWTRDREDCLAAGLALTAGLLAWSLSQDPQGSVLWAFVAALAALLAPWLMYPPALVFTPLVRFIQWFLAKTGLVLVFFLVLTPLALVRRRLGFDPMKRGQWKDGSPSVFTERNLTVASEHLADPY